MHHGSRLPSHFVGPTPATNAHDVKSSTHIAYQPPPIGLVPRPWNFRFNRTPLAPPGTRVLVHEKPSLLSRWSPHAVDGWYLGSAMLHYHCYRVWILETTSERIAHAVVWFPTKVSMPKSSSTDAAMAAARDLTSALLHPSPTSPLSPISDSQHVALQQPSTIFNEITQQSPAKLLTPTTVTTPTVPPASSHC